MKRMIATKCLSHGGTWSVVSCFWYTRKDIIAQKVTAQLCMSMYMRKKESFDIGTELFGMLSLSRLMNTPNARKHVIAKDMRSPEDAGSRNTLGLTTLSKIGGSRTFMRKYSNLLVVCTLILRKGIPSVFIPSTVILSRDQALFPTISVRLSFFVPKIVISRVS